uniref:NlpC/P60 domain-containing protein n=1 Tax=Strix occidentalis caurina TaxID=311401 RepID=A0A8D0EL97_STROC
MLAWQGPSKGGCWQGWVPAGDGLLPGWAVAGAASTAAFFLCEGLLGQHFDVVPNGAAEPQPGDLFLFPLASGGPGWWGTHAGIYCGDGEIIHLEGEPQGVVTVRGRPRGRETGYSVPSAPQASRVVDRRGQSWVQAGAGGRTPGGGWEVAA